MDKWEKLADDKTIERTKKALEANGFTVLIAGNGDEARKLALNSIPKSAEVMTMSSMTLEATGVSKEINEGNAFTSVKKKLFSMNRETQGKEMRQIGAAPDYSIGSVHAVTQDGSVLIASATGSQLSAYAYGGGKIIWIVGTQKVVKNLNDGIKRIYEHCLPLEDARAKKAYGFGSEVNKVLIVNKEKQTERITIILTKEKLGF